MKEQNNGGLNHLLKNIRSINGKAPAFLATSCKGAWANGMTLIIESMDSKEQNTRIGGVSITDRGIRPHRGDSRKSGLPEYNTILYTDQKGSTLTTTHQNYILEGAVCVASRGRKTDSETNQQMLEPCPIKGKTNCLTTVAKDNLLMQSEHEPGTRIRRLTPTECTRLQTIPDWYKWGCSNTQQYKMLGNGWTVEVIKHILSFLPDSLLYPENMAAPETGKQKCGNCALCLHTYLGGECQLTDNTVDYEQDGCIDYISEE